MAPEAASGAMRKPRILVVDDSISIRKFVQRFLDRAGYEVAVAPDGVEALTAMEAEKFDVVITDLEMPVMHGYDLIAEMKRSAELMKIPIVVLTSRAAISTGKRPSKWALKTTSLSPSTNRTCSVRSGKY